MHAQEHWRSSLQQSILFHLWIAGIIAFQSILWPSSPKPYVPVLRVDVVALPEQLKSEAFREKQSQLKKDISEILKSAEKSAKARTAEMKLQQKKSFSSKVEARNRRALDRIKSLSHIEEENSGAEADLSTSELKTRLALGNQLSPGTSEAADAKEAQEANYLDLVRDRLRENWILPAWLSKQNWQAQVQIWLNSQGGLKDLRFLKSSGNVQFDEAVKKAVRDSQPFPEPPQEFKSTLLTDGILMGFPL
ncbi:MAG: energy transducer TonB [Bdellovibrionia bacterium]